MPMVEDSCDPYVAKDHTTGKKCGSHCSAPKSQQWQTKYESIAYVPAKDTARMQQEILAKGAISSCLDIYNDFTGRGVYIKSAGATLRGAHAVTTIGWGVDDSTGVSIPYWLVLNSWVRPAPCDALRGVPARPGPRLSHSLVNSRLPMCAQRRPSIFGNAQRIRPLPALQTARISAAGQCVG
jgi:hypothetical protein